MREILFRGKHARTGEWVEGFYYAQKHRYAGGNRFFGEHAMITTGINETSGGWGESTETIEYEVIPETVGQYTGLIDKNGKKIFEGDIIKSCEYDDVYFVKYCADNNYPAFDVVPEVDIECNGLSHLHVVEGIEVIGNIHDNPELL